MMTSMTREEFEDILTRAGVLPHTEPDDEAEMSERIQEVFALTLRSDLLRTVVEQYVRDHLPRPLGEGDVADLTEQVLVLYSQAIVIGMSMFEKMTTRGDR